jgi:hypothetical protein
MTAYFLDSSALIKRYVIETGTNWVSSITDSRAGNGLLTAAAAEGLTIDDPNAHP